MRVHQTALMICMPLVAACSGGGGSPGGTNSNAPINSVQTTSIAGTVSDTQGNPVNGVNVRAFWTNTNTEVSTTTDSQGKYSFAGLSATSPYGNYEVRAEKNGYAFYPGVPNDDAAVIKSDYNALYRVVIAVPSSHPANIADANFTAFVAGEKRIDVQRSGQTTSYANRDDGALHTGTAWPTTRFVDNQDGTVTDTLTGLLWLKNAGCIAASNWTTAFSSVTQLANGSCGLSDGSTAGQWHLPNIGELESIVDISHVHPALTSNAPFTNVGNAYWSSTTYRGVTSNAWVVRFDDGRYINDSIANAKSTAINSVWAVRPSTVDGAIKLPATGQFIVYATGDDGDTRRGTGLTSPRFIDKGDGTVADTVTGLTWLKQADCIHMQWADAIAAVNSLGNGQCGLSDGSTAGEWRIPNRTELLSLVDRAETNMALRFNTVFHNLDGSISQAAAFNNFIELEFYWTSSTDAADTTMAWTVFSCDYGVYDIPKTNVGYTLAVR